MPLRKGRSQAAISANIKELSHSRTKAGRSRNARANAHAINVAIALRKAGVPRKGSRRR